MNLAFRIRHASVLHASGSPPLENCAFFHGTSLPCTALCPLHNPYPDLALQYSIALCGLSVGPPILNSITLIVGVVLAYFLDGGINKPQLVFTGAAFAAVAVALGAAAHVVTQSAAAAAAANSSSSSTGRQNAKQGKHIRQQKLQQDASQPEDSAHGHEAARAGGLCTTSSSRPCLFTESETCRSLSAADAVMLCSDSDGVSMAGSKDCELGLVTRTALTSLPPLLLQQQQPQGTALGISSTVFSAGHGTAPQDADLPKPATECQAEGQERLQQQQQRSITASRSSSLYLGLAVTVIGASVCRGSAQCLSSCLLGAFVERLLPAALVW